MAGDRARHVLYPRPARPPGWLVLATLVLTLAILYMAVAETTLWTHYLVDEGEFVSLGGLAFILAAGLFLHRQRRLWVSLPLVVPWILYPVVTQADQIIDHLSINQMRVICHAILALLFGAPIVVLVMTARLALEPAAGRSRSPRFWTRGFPGLRLIEQGRAREGSYVMAFGLLMLEMWVAHAFLGELMVVTLVAMGLGLLAYMPRSEAAPDRVGSPGPRSSERIALGMLVVGVGVSLGLYLGFKNRPGAY